MAIYSDEMFNTQGESTTLADMNAGSGSTAGKYAPSLMGKILKVILIWAGEAATSLAEYCRVELNCTIWKPNLLRFGMAMGGIRTAPAFPVPAYEWPIDQQIDTNQQIQGQYIYADAATPVTCNLRVFGLFSA